MDDSDFDDLLGDYLDGALAPNPDLIDAEIEWVYDNIEFGARHILEFHQVSVDEVEEVLLEIPPEVQAKQHKDFPGRTCFWGATRADRWLFVVCEDRLEGGQRYLKPITAFEPEDGENYWRRQ